MNDPITHPRYRNAAVTLHLGDNLGVSLTLPDASVDAVVTVEADAAKDDEPRHVLSVRVVNKGPAPIGGAVAGLPAPAAGARADVPEIAKLLLDAFAAEGNPQALTVARVADRLEAVDGATWGRWVGRTDRLAMVGRTLRGHMRKAGLDVPTTRLDAVPGRPAAYRLADIRRALS